MATPNITKDYFTTIFDEFKTIPAAKLDVLIGVATNRVDQNAWGSNYQYATALLVAHMIASSGGSGGSGGAGGALTSEAVGDLSRGYAKIGVAGSGDEELQTTQYGAQFVALRRESIVTPFVTGAGYPLPPPGYC